MEKIATNERNDLIALVEKQLDWGQVGNWSNYDFEKLSDIIQSKTGVKLSVTTLKRVLGKINSPHAPSITTLNTLAQFIDHKDWRAFQQQNASIVVSLDNQQDPQANSSTQSSIRYWKLILPSALLFIILTTILSSNQEAVYKPSEFEFSANKVYSEGVPNSVVFTYDATKAKTNSIFIAQTWDVRRKTQVPLTGHKHSAIYYYPGFFRTKLMVRDQIVKTHDLQISSNGWLAMIDEGDVPVYFKQDEVVKASGVSISQEQIEQHGFALLPNVPKILIYNHGDFGSIMNDNFTFETQVKNTFKQGTNFCQVVEILIQCKNDIIIIPLCAKGCIGQANLVAAGVEKNSRNADLSKFGANLSEWTTLRVEAKDRLISFYVNDTKAEAFNFSNHPTEIVGIQYRFNGPSAVNYAQFTKGNTIITLQ